MTNTQIGSIAISERSSLSPFPDNLDVMITLEGKGRDWKPVVSNHEELARYAAELSVGRVYAPRIAPANGLLVHSSRFDRVDVGGMQVMNSVEADGTSIRPGESIAMATGDCPVVVMWHPDRVPVVVAHAGRQSLMRGVVRNMVAKLGVVGPARKKIQAYITLGIAAKDFSHPVDHPTYGEANRKMVQDITNEYPFGNCFEDKKLGTLSLHKLILAQCKHCGLDPSNVKRDHRNTYEDKDSEGGFAWHSHRRGDLTRNLVFVHYDARKR